SERALAWAPCQRAGPGLWRFCFFKQKTAYGIFTWLEFRRVLFRSVRQVLGLMSLHGVSQLPVMDGAACVGSVSEATLSVRSLEEIGRASCRERAERAGVAVAWRQKAWAVGRGEAAGTRGSNGKRGG